MLILGLAAGASLATWGGSGWSRCAERCGEKAASAWLLPWATGILCTLLCLGALVGTGKLPT